MAARSSITCAARSLRAVSTLGRNTSLQKSQALQYIRQYPSSRTFSIGSRHLEKKFTKDHEWIELTPDGSIGTIGISDYAADALGDVVFVELPTADTEFAAGDAIGAIESVKSASDILTPVSGTITEANSILEEKPGLINKSPLDEAWLAKIRVSDPKEIDSLMDMEAYQKFTSEAEDDH